METVKRTKKERHEIYVKALKFLKKDSHGLCGVLDDAGAHWPYGHWEYDNKRLSYSHGKIDDAELPEFALFSETCYWEFENFNPYKTRKTVLLFCIEMTR